MKTIYFKMRLRPISIVKTRLASYLIIILTTLSCRNLGVIANLHDLYSRSVLTGQ